MGEGDFVLFCYRWFMKKQLNIYLSNKDEDVPPDYIGIYEIFSNPQYTLPGYSPDEWMLGFKRLDSMRVNTFRNAKKRYLEDKANGFAAYWNSNLDAINSMRLNEFHELSAFTDLASIMICFEVVRVNQRAGSKSRWVSFGVRKDQYKKYSDSLRNALKSGETMNPVKLSDRRKRSRGTLKFAAFYIDSSKPGIKRQVMIPKNEVYDKFVQWCEAKGMTKRDGFYKAMICLMDSEPVASDSTPKQMSDLKYFKEHMTVVPDDKEPREYRFRMRRDVVDYADEIIHRFNNDPDNIGRRKLDRNLYVAQAVLAYNQKMPLKYSDPVGYEEYLKMQKELKEVKENTTITSDDQ